MALLSRATTSFARQHRRHPHDAVAGLAQPLDEVLHLGLDLRRVGRPGEEHELDLRGQLGGGPQEVRQALLPGDPPDEDDAGAVGVDAVAADGVLVGLALPELGVDAVVDDLDLVGVDRGVGPQDVLAHAGAHGDDRVGGLVGRALDPRRDPVAAAELLGLPRPHRLQAVGGEDVRDVAHEAREVAAHVRVPRVRVHEVGSLAGGGEGQVDAEGGQGGVGPGELGEVGVAGRAVLVARLPEGVHPHVEVTALAQGPHELGDVDARAAVDGRRVLLGQDVDAHEKSP